MKIHTTSRIFPMTALAIAILLNWACGGSSDTDGEAKSTAPAAEAPAAEAPAAEAPVAEASAAPAGSSAVAGKVVFDGKAPRLRPIAMNADPGCASKHEGPVAVETLVLGEGQSLGNVFVQVKNAPAGTYPPPVEPAVVDQRGCLYNPRVLGVQAGQTLQFRNSDGLLHNVHGLPKENREFNIGMPPTVTETETKFNKPEPVFRVKCDVHPWMLSYVAVMTHPYFAVTDTSGEFRIEGLPAGTWEIEAWHERLGTHTASVTVADDETGTANFAFTVPSKG